MSANASAFNVGSAANGVTAPEKLSSSSAWKKANPERHAELMRAYRRRNPEKLIAHNRLNYAVRTGLVERGACGKCGTVDRVHAHHRDYSKPLEVEWLCYACHKASHPVSEEDKVIKFAGARHSRLPGVRNPNAKFGLDEVARARVLLSIGLSQQQVADMCGVAQTTISKLARGVTYA